jgi:sarcosine oxidase
MTASPQIAVIGGGIVGLSTAYALADQGVAVRLYEAGLPGTGQSAGESRIFRHAHDDPRLVAFVRESRGVWAEWAERFGVELVSPDGALAIGESALERLRVLEEIGGVAAQAIEALAGALGDAVATGEVISIDPHENGTVEVRSVTDRAVYAKVIVCAGRETARLARSVGLSLPVRLAAHVRPWSEDGVAVWEAGGILFVAGHNLFKQAPSLGRALARAATGDGLATELTPQARLGEPQQ